MRLIRITINDSTYLKNFYTRQPQLRKESYEVQYNTLMVDCYAWADFWTHALGKRGYTAWEPVGNAEPMQKTWARENGVNFNEESWFTDIITAQVKFFRPDVLFVDGGGAYTADFIRHLRTECPSIKLILDWCGAPYADTYRFSACDVVLSNIPELIGHLRYEGHKSEHLMHAFEPRVLDRIDKNQRKNIDFSFFGSIIKKGLFHNQREILIRELIRKTNLQIFSNIYRPSSRAIRLRGLRELLRNYASLKKHPSLSDYVDISITRKANPPLFGIEMFQALHDSKVTLNTHIDISLRSASNMRLFEATGIGTCLLTDWKEDLHELFEIDKEIVAYRSAEECVEKAKWLLGHPEKRKEIARAGQDRILKEHTFSQRAFELDRIINSSITENCGSLRRN